MRKYLTIPIILLLGGCGAAAAPKAAVTVTSEPLPAVTVTSDPVTVTKEVKVPVTPQACKDAIDAANAIMSASAEGTDLYSQALNIAAQAVQAAALADWATMDRLTDQLGGVNEKLQKVTAEINSSKYPSLRNQCTES